jgi:hypothetical protein
VYATGRCPSRGSNPTSNASDGIVDVHEDVCGHQVLACLLMLVTPAGDHRIVHIKVDARKRGIARMAHETFETNAAVQTELDIHAELRQWENVRTRLARQEEGSVRGPAVMR